MVFSGESCGEAIIAEFNVIDRSNALLTNPALVIRIILLRFAKCTHHASGPLGEPTQINNGRFCTAVESWSGTFQPNVNSIWKSKLVVLAFLWTIESKSNTIDAPNHRT